MTVTIEPTAQNEAILQREASRRGLSIEQLARELFEQMLEDLEDASDAQRILENTDSSQWRSLDELRQSVRTA